MLNAGKKNVGTRAALAAFEPLIDQIELNLAIAIEFDYPDREQLLFAIAEQLQEASCALLDLSKQARLACARRRV